MGCCRENLSDVCVDRHSQCKRDLLARLIGQGHVALGLLLSGVSTVLDGDLGDRRDLKHHADNVRHLLKQYQID